MLDHRPDVFRKGPLGKKIDDGSAARRLVELVEIISRGIRAKPLEDRHVAAVASFVYGADARVTISVLAAVILTRTAPVADVDRVCSRVRSGPNGRLVARFVFLASAV